MSWMIYGATGYTGKLILEEAVKRGEKPVIAGRNEKGLQELSTQHQVPFRLFSLENEDEILSGIKGVRAVLHCAGPFSKTMKPMADACLASGIHYLDITGEITVFESLFQRNKEAQDRKCVLLPGVGFDIFPTDCLAALLKKKLPDATELELAIHGWGKLSPGTTKTLFENLTRGSQIRRDGKIKEIPAFSLSSAANFSDGKRTVYATAWGDVSTAYFSTGIPNITVYAEAPASLIKWRHLLSKVAPLSEIPFVQGLFSKLIEKYVKGPTKEEQAKGRVYLWGRVRNSKGEVHEGTLDVCEAYHFTALSAVTSVQKLLNREVPGGCYTPSLLFGPEIIESFSEATLRL